MSAPVVKPDLPSEEKVLADSLATLGEKSKVVYARFGRVKILVSRENLVEVARFVKDLHFDHAENLTGKDFPKEKQLEIAYYFSLDRRSEPEESIACSLVQSAQQ